MFCIKIEWKHEFQATENINQRLINKILVFLLRFYYREKLFAALLAYCSLVTELFTGCF